MMLGNLNLRKLIIENRWFLLSFVLTIILLLVGNNHNYPYILHPDEPTTVKTALAQSYKFGVDRFDWGHLGFYTQYFLYIVFLKARAFFDIVGLGQFLRENLRILYMDPYIFYLITRVSTAIMSIFTILFIYKICRLFFSKTVSTLATTFLVVAPYFLRLSHYAVQDPPQLFYLTLSLYFFLQKPFYKSFRNLILSSVFLACSAAYKFNVIFFIPFFYLANLLLEIKPGDLVKHFFTWRNLKLVLLWSITFFVVFFTIHYTIFTDWDTFWSNKPSYGFKWQIQINSGSRDNYNLPAMSALLFNDLSLTFSPVTAGFILIAIFYTLFSSVKNIRDKKYSKQDLIISTLIISAAILVAVMMKSNKYREHYLFPIYPMIVLSVAYFIENFKPLRKFKYLYLLLLIHPLLLSSVQAIKMSRMSTTSIVVNEILEDKDRRKLYYYKSDDIHNVKLWNFIDGLQSMSSRAELENSGDILVTDTPTSNENYELIKVQDNHLRLGSTYYFYRKK